MSTVASIAEITTGRACPLLDKDKFWPQIHMYFRTTKQCSLYSVVNTDVIVNRYLRYVGPAYCDPKCTVAASHVAPLWVMVSMPRDSQTDGRMSDRYITLSAKRKRHNNNGTQPYELQTMHIHVNTPALMLSERVFSKFQFFILLTVLHGGLANRFWDSEHLLCHFLHYSI